MNVIREIGRINERELDLGGDGVSSSWHDDYKDSAYVFVGGLPYNLTEGDVITIFSQFGEIVDINMPRDRETHKAKGFSFLMYEDQRSTVLAVDNMNGAKVLGRTVRVDHVRSYRHPDKTNEEGDRVEAEEPTYNAMPPLIGGGDDSDDSSDTDGRRSADDEDPMAAYIKAQKREAKQAKKAKKEKSKEKDSKKSRKHENETKEEKAARKREKKERKEGKRTQMGLEDRDRDIRDQSRERTRVKRESQDREPSAHTRGFYSEDRSSHRNGESSRSGAVSPPPRARSPAAAVKRESDADWRSARDDTFSRHDRGQAERDRGFDRDRAYKQRDADRTVRQMGQAREDRDARYRGNERERSPVRRRDDDYGRDRRSDDRPRRD